MDRIFWFIGNVLLRVAWPITRLGRWFCNKGINASTYTKAMGFLDHTFPDELSNEVKLSTKIKKGGCEVQTGSFRRVDCEEQL